MNKLTIGQRIMADTPPFFKGIQILSATLLLIAAVMVKFNIGSADTHSLLGTVGFSALAVAQCAAKDIAALSQGVTLPAVLQAFTDTTSEINAVKSQIASPAPLPGIADAVQGVSEAFNAAQGTTPTAADINASIMAKAASQLSVVKD